MNANVHDRIEAIAGAIALGEASDEERREYRLHIASCATCVRELGGEHEIERVASTVVQARDCEVWEPALGDVVANRMRRRSRAMRWGFSVFGAALAASFGIHALLAAGIQPMPRVPAAPSAASGDVTHVALEQRSAPAPKTQSVTVAPPQRLIVTHNVVQIARAPLPASDADALASAKVDKPRQLIEMTVHPNADVPHHSHHSNVPVWRRADTQWRTVAQTTTTSVTETAPETLTHNAEAIQVATNYPTREVAPLGGETAINPQPPMIAYAEGAEGTTVFEVHVDDRGNATRCVITKSAGYTVLDDAVCKAAMKARYSPKIVEGRAVPGVYRDAFTFHMSDDSSEGVQSQIPAAGPLRNPSPRSTDEPDGSMPYSHGGGGVNNLPGT